jgi:MFS family permease
MTVRHSPHWTSRSASRRVSPPPALLLIGASLSAIGAAGVVPAFEPMREHFGDAALVPIVLGAPALGMVVFAPVAGTLLDWFGRRFWIPVGLLLFAVAGLAPLVLDSLPAIAVSRVLVGLATAMVVTACTALIGDEFSGSDRARLLALLTVGNALAATAALGIGDALGDLSWRAPFLIFAVGGLLFPAMVRVRPLRHAAARRADAAERTRRSPRLRSLAPILLLTVVASVMVNVPLLETPALMAQTGVLPEGLTGLIVCLTAFSTVAGAIAVREVIDARPGRLLASGFGLIAVGFAIVAVCRSLDGVVIGVVAILGLLLANFGSGVLLPPLLTRCLRDLDYERRGRAAGLWHAAFFLGQALTPAAFLVISDLTGSPFTAVGAAAALSLAMALRTGLAGARTRSRPTGSQHRHPATPVAAHAAPAAAQRYGVEGRQSPRRRGDPVRGDERRW